MRWLKKLVGKEESHDDWLAKHPGKESKKHAPPPVDLEEEARVRSTMEAEMDEARERRDKED